MQETKLFGGAISTVLPERFVDVSNFRQVPDHQEVYVSDKEPDDSVILELLERLDLDDQEAFKEHINEVSTLNGSKFNMIRLEKGIVPSLPDSPTYICTGTQNSRKWGRDEQVSAVDSDGTTMAAEVLSFLALIRLEKVATDFLVTLNLSCNTPDQMEDLRSFVTGGEVARFEQARARFQTMLQAFQVNDWGLFGE